MAAAGSGCPSPDRPTTWPRRRAVWGGGCPGCGFKRPSGSGDRHVENQRSSWGSSESASTVRRFLGLVVSAQKTISKPNLESVPARTFGAGNPRGADREEVVHRLLNAEQAIGGMTPKAFAVNMTTLLGCGRARRTRWPRSPRLGALSSQNFGCQSENCLYRIDTVFRLLFDCSAL